MQYAQWLQDKKIPASKPKASIDLTKIGKQKIENPTATLLDEARKYKTADEFVKAQGDSFYHTTPAQFDKFDKKFLGENTNYDNAMFGFFFADNLAQIDQFKDLSLIHIWRCRRRG